MKLQHPIIFSLITLLISAGLSTKTFTAPCATTVDWHNLSDVGCGPGQTNPGITANVTDQNIDIIGTNAIVGGITVAAVTCDITISVVTNDSVITGSERCDGAPTPPPVLYLFTNPGLSITFDLQFDLTFRGTGIAGQETPVPLMVLIYGAGTVNFALADNTVVSFTSIPGSGGTFLFVGMDSVYQPTLEFSRQDPNSPNDVEVVVGNGSLVTYIATPGDPGIGTILFNPTNLNPNGLMVLTLQNCSGFNIGGHSVDIPFPDGPTLDNIDFWTVEGLTAEMIILNDNPAGPAQGIVTVVNENQCACGTLFANPFCEGILTGTPIGFVLGPVGYLGLTNLTYLDYIGTTDNTCCPVTLFNSCGVPYFTERLRNGSAFIVDSLPGVPAIINFLGAAAIYFRSGVDNCGSIAPDFVVSPSVITPCAGNIVFDVEGFLNVVGTPGFNSGLNILSLQVDPTGCPIIVGGPEAPVFPSRTFARDAENRYLAYNRGAFLINNRMDLFNTGLIHTDEIHNVYQRDTLLQGLRSDPTYVGGDSYLICDRPTQGRPTIAFYNSNLYVNTSLAANGVDWLVPNFQTGNNISNFIFYSNGSCIDQGYGRNMILGTTPCFVGCCITTTDDTSQLNVFQENAQATPFLQVLNFLSASNDTCITEGIVGDISSQVSVQTIFLNNGSNFSIGTPAPVGTDIFGNEFTLTSTGQVFINGSCFSFESSGGRALLPEISGTTGQGGIFVDKLGVFSLLNNLIANFSTMVTKSLGGVVDLPQSGAFFGPGVGISDWQINLTDPTQLVIIPAGQSLAEYTFDWGGVTKNYCCNSVATDCFIPYDGVSIPGPCMCPAVTNANLTSLPTIEGAVQQFQILRARICDVPHIKVDGGYIRELVFLNGLNSAEAPVAFLVTTNDAVVGLGSTHKNIDSLDASIVLGINGVILCPDGDSTIILNEDVIINNVCPIVTGTNFGLIGENTLTIRSIDTQKLLIRSTGALDLSLFTTPNMILNFAGQVQLVAEPGARIIMNGGVLSFSDNAQWVLEPTSDLALLTGVTTSDLDPIRVRLSGTGFVNMHDNSSMFIPLNGFFGIEAYPVCSLTTNILWTLFDQSRLQIGSEEQPGGAFQIGDTVVTNPLLPQPEIFFNLTLDGIGTIFQIDRQGFFGLAAGIVDKAATIPNTWAVSCLSDVMSVTITIPEGTMQHNQIVNNNSALGSLLAIGSGNSYDFNFDPAASVIRGGGNLVKINCTVVCVEGSCVVVPESVNPTVTTFNGLQPGGFVQSGIMGSKAILASKVPNTSTALVGGSAQALFNFLSSPTIESQSSPKASIASDQLNLATIGYISGGTLINRQGVLNILAGAGLSAVDPSVSLQIGSVLANYNPTLGIVDNTIQMQSR
jgi:hypothetical protein